MNGIGWTERAARAFACGLMFFTLMLAAGCSSDNPTDPGTSGASGVLVSHGECKYAETSRTMDGTPQYLDCVVFDYDGSGSLNLVHVNSAFNCCPIGVDATVNVVGNQITITELQALGECSCMCLYDLEYLIEDLPPGAYHLTMVGYYLPDGEDPLECTLDLTGGTSGECCVERFYYPWT